jgi:two-component system chemotaxis sensor kinase CheA
VGSGEFLELFVSEAREHLDGQNALLARARGGPLGQDDINELFRHAHSLKGMAMSLGLRPIAALAHAMEDLLHDWRNGSLTPPPETLDLLLRASDRLAAQVDAVAAGAEPPAAGDLVGALRSACGPDAAAGDGAGRTAAPADSPAPGAVVAADGGVPAGAGDVPADPDAGRPGAPDGPRLRVEVVIRSDAPLPAARAMVVLRRLGEQGVVLGVSPTPEEIARGPFPGRLEATLASAADADRLAALIGAEPDVAGCRVARLEPEPPPSAAPERAAEPAPKRQGEPSPERPAERAAADGGPPRAEGIATIRVATERLDNLLDGVGELILDRERLKRYLDPDPGSPAAGVLQSLGRTVDALHGEIMQMRLLPFSSIVPRLQRTVRDLAHRLGKSIELVARGADVALDRSILEELLDPLEHVLRNAIDHGLEDAAGRQAAGKPPTGRIEIDLRRDEDRVVLALSDDGRGIDPAGLRRVAVERRFITREAAARMSDEEALMLVTIPGFSTAARTTDISGRGVGMDVVRMRVQKIGGRLTIRSEPGRGTRLEMELPPAVTVTRAFLCRAAGEVYAVPVAAVEAMLEVRRDGLRASQGEHLAARGDDDLVTVLPLDGLLAGDPAAAFPAAFPALVYRVGRRSYALAVDEVLGEQEIVVKPLRHPLELLPQYAGAAILNDGRIALILDPANLTRTARPA